MTEHRTRDIEETCKWCFQEYGASKALLVWYDQYDENAGKELPGEDFSSASWWKFRPYEESEAGVRRGCEIDHGSGNKRMRLQRLQ